MYLMAQVLGFIDQEGQFHIRADCPYLTSFWTGALSLTSPTSGIEWCPGCVFLAVTELVRLRQSRDDQDGCATPSLDLTEPPEGHQEDQE